MVSQSTRLIPAIDDEGETKLFSVEALWRTSSSRASKKRSRLALRAGGRAASFRRQLVQVSR